jgi:hypothetical protein
LQLDDSNRVTLNLHGATLPQQRHYVVSNSDGFAAGSMSFSRAHQISIAELENNLPGANGADDIRIHICNRLVSHFECERLALGVPIIFAELVQIVGYLTIKIGRAHVYSYAFLSSA